MTDPLLRPLESRVQGRVRAGTQVPAELATNFGHLHHGPPRFVVEPQTAADVAAAVRFAREHGLHVATRGSAHSQSQVAISRGGILLAMRSLSRILDLDAAACTVDVEGGVVWRDLVHWLGRHDLAPPVLTNNLEVTVGGTLSVAGIGVASFRHGSQGDNVLELDVVTGAGDLVTCSPEREADLFWSAIAGLGQVGVIVRARLRLRRIRPMTRTYYLLYPDVRSFFRDAEAAMDAEGWDHLESWAAPCPQGTRGGPGGRRQVFARWFFPFHLSAEFDPGSPPDDERLLAGLRPFERVHTEDVPTVGFFERLVPVFDLWKRAGTWEHLHPWMEAVLPWAAAPKYVEGVLAELPPALLVGGHVLIWPARGAASRSRLFMRPPGERVVGFGILPAVAPRDWPAVKPLLEQASRLAVQVGGKRYLSGWIEFDEAQWKAHFGERWEPFRQAKARFDPDGVLNPGFVPLGSHP